MQRVILVQPLSKGQGEPKLRLQLLFEPGHIPLFFNAHRSNKAINGIVDNIFTDGSNRLADLIIGEQFIPLTVDNLPLVIGNIVVFEQLFTNVEVAPLYLTLRLFDGVGHHTMLNGLTALHAQRQHETLHALRGKDPHQVIFQREIKP